MQDTADLPLIAGDLVVEAAVENESGPLLVHELGWWSLGHSRVRPLPFDCMAKAFHAVLISGEGSPTALPLIL